MKREPAFKVRDLTKTYQMGEVQIHALQKINLDLFQGELIVLLGPSGSGKSTLLNIIGGLDVPTSGEVIYKDHIITASSELELTRYRREHIGFVFQFYNLISNLTALENISIVTEIAENPMDPVEAIKLLGLENRISHFPSQLSGGEQQRVAIARAIAKQPDVLLCDEPTGALDCETGKIVLETLELANKKLNTTVVIITHNLVIGEMADRIIHIADGRISQIVENKSKRKAADLSW
ncbi:ABC transporter ATP-binding protein [Legionella waltersii]|uniref:ABC transporter ATP-binding protein n=1 Tax=Legionella waltersii TaxID=66969 RepID=A0A0W1AK86_9GAMM|nr:ABC transporter ATP-binding protein [Legionella waltersii]KTD81745.1 ABC transporter ATP-binding protein [Legionella waltersii]SNU97039.1 ABC transporter ATP-binding protein [Legionella waltersii]